MFAKSIKEVKQIFTDYGATVFNFVFADIDDNILYYAPPLIPKRKNRISGVRGIKEGFSGKDEWEGFLEFDKNPHVMNPEKGYLFTANQR